MKTKLSHYHIILRPEPEGGYTVIVPSLAGCVTYGRTLREAKTMAADAIKAYVESLKKHREPIPTDTERNAFCDTPRNGIPQGGLIEISQT